MAYVTDDGTLIGVRLHGRTVQGWPRLRGRAGIVEFLTRPFKDVDDRASYQSTARRAEGEAGGRSRRKR